MARRCPVVIALLLVLLTGIPAFSAIKGKVVDKDGKPVTKAKVSVLFGPKLEDQKPTVVQLDKNGAFTFELPAKTIWGVVCAEADGYCRCSTNFSSEYPRDTVLTIWPERKVTLLVVDEKGNPVEGATVQNSGWYGYDANYHQHRSESDPKSKPATGKDGTVVLRNLPNPEGFNHGNISFSVVAKGRALVQQAVDLKDLTEKITLTDPLECKLQGKLWLPGKTGPAPEGTELQVTGSGNIQIAPVGKDGSFEFKQLIPGAVTVQLHEDYGYGIENGKIKTPPMKPWVLAIVKDVNLSPDKVKNLELELSTGALVKGRVIDSRTSKPAQDAIVEANHAGSHNTTRTDANGEFTLRVAAGEVTVYLSCVYGKDMYSVHFEPDERPTATFQIAEGQEKNDIEFQFSMLDNKQVAYNMQGQKVPNDFVLMPGTYDMVWDQEIHCFDDVWNRFMMQGEEAKKQMTKLPALKSEKAKYIGFWFDDKDRNNSLFVILDESEGTDHGFDTAYIDTNRNKDLSDDQALKFKKGMNYHRSPWVEASTHQGRLDGDHLSLPMNVRISIMNHSSDMVLLERKGAWRCTANSNKGKVELVLVDSNYNGIYAEHTCLNEKSELTGGDHAFTDTTGFGSAVTYEQGPHSIELADVTRIGKRFYVIKGNGTGSELTIEPYKGTYGKLSVQVEAVQGHKLVAESTSIYGKTGYSSFDCKDGYALLPEGRYKLSGCNLAVKSKTGKDFKLACRIDTPVEIKGNQKTEIVIGGKLDMAINPNEKEIVWKPLTSGQLDWIIRIGDKATAYSIGDRRPEMIPKIKLYDATGKYVRSVTAGYT